MTTWNWKSIIEIVGIVSIVGSLALVALELRQTQEVQIAEAHTIRAERAIELRRLISELGTRAIARKVENGEEITASDLDNLFNLNYAYLIHYEDMYFQRRQGYIDDETWESKLRGLGQLVNYPGFSLVADPILGDAYQSGFENSFLDLVRQMID